MTHEEIAEKYSRRAEFQRHDGIVLGNIQVTHWEHNVKELILKAIIEATTNMWAEDELKEFGWFMHRYRLSCVSDSQEIVDKGFEQWQKEYKHKQNNAPTT